MHDSVCEVNYCSLQAMLRYKLQLMQTLPSCIGCLSILWNSLL